MKKILFALLFLPMFGAAQSVANILHYKLATPTDTTFQTATGLLRIDTAITISDTHYSAVRGEDYTSPMTDEIFTPYTLSNGWSALVRRFCNNELEAVTVDEGGKGGCMVL